MGAVHSVDSCLGNGFVTHTFREVVGTFETGVENISFAAFCAPVVVDKKRTFVGCEFRRIVF